MKKGILRSAFAIAIATVLCFTGCAQGKSGGGKGEVNLFSAYITDIILQGDKVEESDRLPAKFAYSAGKGETEAAQIIMEAISDVDYYGLQVADLSGDGGRVFSKDNFEVFDQMYIHVTGSTKGEYGRFGYYPDILMPMSVSAEYGENKIKAGENQAIIVQAKVPATQEAGTYTGKFTLTVDKKTTDIPVTLKVYDVEVPQTTRLESLYIITRDYMAIGEADSTMAMYKKYYDKLLEYKSMGYFLPASMGDPKGYADMVREYYDKIANYAIPYSYDYVNGQYTLQKAGTKNYLDPIVEYSLIDGINYLDKARNYYGVVDEPIGNNTVGKCNNFCITYNSVVKELADEYRAQADDDQDLTEDQKNFLREEIAQAVEDMPNYVTAYPNEQLDPAVRNFCPVFSHFDSEVEREEYVNDSWWYGCTSPRNPYPSFHIDDENHLASTEMLGFLSAEYDVKGVLYWEVAAYANASSGNGVTSADCYEQAMHNTNSNGEGYLFYPGAPYGIDGPVVSNRLLSMRDGCDDYDIISLLKEQYAEKGYDFNDALNVVYDGLRSGTKVFDGIGERLVKAKETLFDLIIMAREEGFFVTGSSETDEGFVVTGVTPEGKSVKAGGEKLSDGGAFAYGVTLDSYEKSFTFTCGDHSVNYRAYGKKSKVYSESDRSFTFTGEGVSCAEEDLDKPEYRGKAMHVNFGDERYFNITMEDHSKMFNSKTRDFMMKVYNPTGERLVAEIRLQGYMYDFSLISVFIEPGLSVLHFGDVSTVLWNLHRKIYNASITIAGDSDMSSGLYVIEAYRTEVK